MITESSQTTAIQQVTIRDYSMLQEMATGCKHETGEGVFGGWGYTSRSSQTRYTLHETTRDHSYYSPIKNQCLHTCAP